MSRPFLILVLIFSLSLSTVIPARAVDPPHATLVFVGDVMVGRSIGQLLQRTGQAYPFVAIRPLLAQADATFGNLESPLTEQPQVVRGYNLQGHPANVESLLYAGFDVMSVANNHATDHGEPGLAETLRTLDEAGIAHVGAAATITGAYATHWRVIGPMTVAYLAYDGTGGSKTVTASEAGTANAHAERVVHDIAYARQRADLVVVSVHWGLEYHDLPTPRQRQLAEQYAKAGADLIIGHHPHVVQPLEWITANGRQSPTLVAYSLGNFLFDQEWSVPTSEGALLVVRATKAGLASVDLVPTRIRKMQVHAATSREAGAALARMLWVGLRQPEWQSYSLVTLPEGQRDFRLTWWTHAPPIASTPLTADWDGDGQSESAVVTEGVASVVAANGSVLWQSSSVWQALNAMLDDVDGDGRAELVMLGQWSEEHVPADGVHVFVWKAGPGPSHPLFVSPPGSYQQMVMIEGESSKVHSIGVKSN